MPKITSIKLSNDHTEIEFLETKQTQTVTSLLKDAMAPMPEFVANFAALKNLANEICDGKLSNFKSFKVTQLWFKENKNGAAGCMMHVEVKLETNNRPLHFNTPPKYALGESQDASEYYLKGHSVDLLKKLEQNAIDFMHGVRAQQTLALDDKKEDYRESEEDRKLREAAQEEELQQEEETIFENEPPQGEKKKALLKNRKTCMDCNAPSAMVIDGQGYCEKHGNQHLTT